MTAAARLEATCRVAFPGFTLDAALDLPLAGITGIFGASGSGKTTLLRALAGLEPHCRGRIAIDGEVWQDDRRGVFLPVHERALGFVFQDARLFPHLSVAGNLDYGRRRRRGERAGPERERVIEVLGLGPFLARRPEGLSGGERQRVAIGRALLAGARLLLMDEPLAALDAARKSEILPLIERLRDELRLPVLYVSHAIDEVIRLADTMVLLSNGRVEAAGAVEELTGRLDLYPLTGRYEAGAVISTRVAEHDAAFGLSYLEFSGGRFVVPAIDLPLGTPVRLRIRARDVALATAAPENTSILNQLRGTVAEMSAEGESQVDVAIDVGGHRLIARITRRAAHQLDLRRGRPVHALIKAIAIDRRSMGRPRPRADLV
jgi:molybdate transport system ATP-binding protein